MVKKYSIGQIIGFIIGVIIIIALVIGVVILQGWIISLLWNFLASYFGFKTITVWIGCGIGLALGIVAGFFKNSSSKK